MNLKNILHSNLNCGQKNLSRKEIMQKMILLVSFVSLWHATYEGTRLLLIHSFWGFKVHDCMGLVGPAVCRGQRRQQQSTWEKSHGQPGSGDSWTSGLCNQPSCEDFLSRAHPQQTKTLPLGPPHKHQHWSKPLPLAPLTEGFRLQISAWVSHSLYKPAINLT